MAQVSGVIDYYKKMPLDDTRIYNEFKKTSIENRFFQNKEYLINNSSQVKFNSNLWHLRPEYYCFNYYGDSNLYPVILMVNNISTRFNFRREKFLNNGIITPTAEAIMNVLNQII